MDDIVCALAASPFFAEDGICFAAKSSGLLRSDDGCKSWRTAYSSLETDNLPPTTAVAVTRIEAGAPLAIFAGIRGEILRSLDSGLTWQSAILPEPPPVPTSLVVSPNYASDGTVVAATMEDGVFVSTDRGARWDGWTFGLVDQHVLAVLPSPAFGRDTSIFAACETGIFASTNAGRSWRDLPFPIKHAPVLSLAISPRFENDGLLWAGTESGGVWVTRDRGIRWAPVGDCPLDGPINSLILGQDREARPALLALAGSSLRYTIDGGALWHPVDATFDSDGEITCVEAPTGFSPQASLIIGTSLGEVIRLR